MTVSETDRRRRRLLVRSLMGGHSDPGSTDGIATAEFSTAADETPPDGELDFSRSRPVRSTDFASVAPLPVAPVQRPMPTTPQSKLFGPIRVVESQLDAVLRTLGAVASSTTSPPPVAPPPSPPRQPTASSSPPLMLPPFQNMPARRPAAFRHSTPIEAPSELAAANPRSSKPASVAAPPKTPASDVAMEAAPPVKIAASPVLAAPVLASPDAAVPVAEMPAPAMPAVKPGAAVIDPIPVLPAPPSPVVSERPDVLRSRSKIGTMKQDAAALSARLKELAKMLEEHPDDPSDDALCAWDDCRRLALLLHHELDRGLPQPESQRGSRAVARSR